MALINQLKQTFTRRSLLQKSLLCLAGAFGPRLATGEVQPAKTQSAPAGAQTLTFYTSALRSRAPGQAPGKLPSWNGRANRHGDLLDRPAGKKVGEFGATCFGPEGGAGGFNLELQTVKLGEGTLFGIGSGASSDDQKVHAIVGGTGRFAGAKGSFVVRRNPGNGSDKAVEFVITLLT